MLALARPKEVNMGIDWNDNDMVELIDVLISNPDVIRRYINCSDADELVESINEDYPELEVSKADIPRLISMVKARYSNGW